MNEPATTSAPSTGPDWRERLGWRAERRPRLGFGHVLGAGAGVFALSATQGVIGEVAGDDATVPGVLFTLGLLAVALVAGLRFPGPIRAAAVSVGVLSVPTLWFWALLGDFNGGRGELRGVLLLSLASYAVLYLLVWTRGRAVLLAAALLVLGLWLMFEVGGKDASANSIAQSLGSPGLTTTDPLSNTQIFGGDLQGGLGTQTDESATMLVVGLGYLAAAFVLDRRRLTGAATPFLALGAFFAIFGSLALGANESVAAGGLAVAGAGAVVGLVGGLGQNRRGTIWVGVIAVVIGLIIAIGDTANSALGYAGLAALVAIGLGAIGIVAARQLEEVVDGDDRAPITDTTPPSTDETATPPAPAT